MNKIILLPIIILCGFFLLFFNRVAIINIFDLGETLFSADNYTEAFYDNCGLPAANSLTVKAASSGSVLIFRLKDKDIGLCSSDDRNRHSAPYWERAELKQIERLDRGFIYTLDFTFTLKQGFDNSRETIFQLHNYAKGCKTSPAAMLKFDHGKMLLWTKQKGDSKSYTSGLTAEKIMDQPQRISWIVDTSNPAAFSLLINNQLVVNKAEIDLAACGNPHFKFGIYRPGNDSRANSTSIIEFMHLSLISSHPETGS